MNRVMKMIVMAGVFVMLGFAQSNAQVVVVKKPVKPRVVVVKPAKPGSKHVWVEGHWKWNKRVKVYVWKKGYWVKRKPNHVWIAGRWKRAPKGHVWIPGHWKRA